MPEDRKDYEKKVAFMGQVPIQVFGRVAIGDYILPSGLQNGLGKAVAPTDMKPEDFANIVGIAWSASLDDQFNLVNVAIGLNTMDISKVVIDQNKELLELEKEFDESNKILADILPGFKGAMGFSEEEILKNQSLVYTNRIGQSLKSATSKAAAYNFQDFNFNQFSETIQFVEKVFSKNGKDLTNNAYWSQLKTDPGVFDQFMKNMKSLYPDVETNSMDLIKSGK
ncbi:MAG: hypothetical protein IPO25_18560 [Saprospiraceae bacterium]|nr:hypothetical protein [Saprospiraceae bacterium]